MDYMEHGPSSEANSSHLVNEAPTLTKFATNNYPRTKPAVLNITTT